MQIISRTSRHSQLRDVNTPHTTGDLAAAVKGYELIDDTIVSGGAVSDYDVTGLDAEAEGGYILVVHVKGAGNSSIYLYFNGDTTATNYYYQHISGNHTTVTASRANSPIVGDTGAGESSQADIIITKVPGMEGLARATSVYSSAAATYLSVRGMKGVSTTNITQLTLHCLSGNHFDDGTRFQLFRRLV